MAVVAVMAAVVEVAVMAAVVEVGWRLCTADFAAIDDAADIR